jgi:drug/metabolite transporter (DMT)-like permease
LTNTIASQKSPKFLSGIFAAIGAGACWGLVFIAPLLLANYPAPILAFGRYLAFGLICLPIAWFSWSAIKKLSAADWWFAARLSLVGNIVYYCALAAAIQLAGAPSISALIGTLPIVIAIAANRGKQAVPWSSLVLPLVTIGVGLFCINYRELEHLQTSSAQGGSGFFVGIGVGLIALAAWTWYPIKNSQWLQAHPQHSAQTWASVQGLATLPLAVIGYLASYLVSRLFNQSFAQFDWPLGPQPLYFIGLMMTMGLVASWLGTLMWNYTSSVLPATLSGQLIVFETLAALIFAYSLRGQWPDTLSASGICLLILGVIFGIRAFR